MTTISSPVHSSCPVCGLGEYEPLFPVYAGRSITSDYAVLPNAGVDNRCCKGCGLIYNATGTRGFTDEFYRDSYSLMLRKESSAIQNFSGPKPMSQAERSFNIFIEMVKPQAYGKILEAGAGKGEFLTHVVDKLAGWHISAFEPSAAFEVLKSRLPQAEVRHGGYGDYSASESFDAVVALGVLEHVENPLDMMRWAADRLNLGGIFFVRVPNFANNPNDLFCADHLSKLTLPTLRGLGAAAGFEVLAEREDGVPVYIALRKVAGANTRKSINGFEENIVIARKNSQIAQKSLNAVGDCRRAAHEGGERFAIFGLGSSGLFAPFYGDFSAAEIEAYIDENKTMWGSEVHGRPVLGLDAISERQIKHIALAISPVYVPKVTEKLLPLGVKVYAA